MAPPTMFPTSDHNSIQKYMLLSSQQEALSRRMSIPVPCAAPMSTTSPEFRSVAPSPTSQTSFSTTWSPEPDFSSRFSTTTDPIPVQQPGVGHRHSIADPEDAQRLFMINKEIKATLTELLNTESVRSDDKYRQWIQERLMDAEHQIRQQRRRRSSGSAVDREFASSIAEHMDMGLHLNKAWA